MENNFEIYVSTMKVSANFQTMSNQSAANKFHFRKQ